MSTEPSPMQFDKAEYGQGPAAPSGIACAACKRPIVDQYYEAVSKVFCQSCATLLMAGPKGGSRVWRTIEALLLGTIGGMIGAVIWFLIWKLTGYQLGLIAIVVGVLVGGGVRKGSRGRGGWFYQLMAIGITYAAITATNIPPIIELLNEHAVKDHDETIANAKKTAKLTLHKDGTIRVDDREVANSDIEKELDQLKGEGTTLLVHRDGRADGMARDEADELHDRIKDREIPMAYFKDSTFQTPLYLNYAEMSRSPLRRIIVLGLGFLFALILPFLTLPENIMGVFIIAIALYQAWKINKKPRLAITGPFVLSTSASLASGSIVHVPPPVTPPNPPAAFGESPQDPMSS